MRTSPSSRLTSSRWPGSTRLSSDPSSEGTTKNSPTASTMASTTAQKMTMSSWLRPVTRLSHFSNREGASSSTSSPIIWAERVMVFMPVTRDWMKAATPRTTGQPRTLWRLDRGTKSSTWVSILPSAGRRTAMARRVGARIMTPSITAWPPM